MACVYCSTCPFFESTVGYSPELKIAMKKRFCLSDGQGCARFIALATVGRENVPPDLLPCDCDRLVELGLPREYVAEYKQ
ncbi:MAG: hypothetical protein KJ747_09845 [Actinobacteria bacterium]|nr:hypothetical protein [Actinomycetota bacterium]MCG2808220.1 hypothetical protein [Coriobacteriia bacterium]